MQKFAVSKQPPPLSPLASKYILMKLIVLNLPRNFSENDLAKLFKLHGNIKDCKLVLDAKTGESKGFGFVEMALEHEAMKAIQELNGKTIAKKKIRVKASQ